MNYLAHCLLSGADDEILIGNFIADAVRPKEMESYSGKVLEGIYLHRAIDSFTDQHRYVREAILILRPRHGKYSSVIIDILWDYFLIKNWSRYCQTDKSVYIANVYKNLRKHKDQMPKKLQGRIDSLIETDFLAAFGHREGLKRSFTYMDKRTKFPSDFVSAIQDLDDNEEEFDRLFNLFFPELLAMAEGWEMG